MNFWKKCPLLIFLLVSGFIISVISRVNLDGIYRDYKSETVMTPVLAAFFKGIKEENYPWTALEPQTIEVLASGDEEEPDTVETPVEAEAGKEDENAIPEPADTEEASGSGQDAEDALEDAVESRQEAAQEGVENGEDQTEAPVVAPQEETGAEGMTEPQEEDGTENAAEAPEGIEAEPVVWQLGSVEEDYFDDALFIGDSRTQGLYEYGGLGENVTFYSKTSLTVYDLFKKEKEFIREDGENITLEQALTKHSFKKIYLMVGINELGTGTAESFFEEYARAVFKIQQLQPDAIIFVQAIMRVGAQKNATDPIFNNTNIAIRNVEIQTLADNQKIFYIDVNEVVCDENGNLFDGWSSDQIHLKAKYYAVWKEFLMNHGAVPAGTDP